MNKKQLIKIGVPSACIAQAIAAAQTVPRDMGKPKNLIPKIVADPNAWLSDAHFGEFAQSLIDDSAQDRTLTSIPYSRWGDDFDATSIRQIENACRLPIAVGAALMPDAHSGYGLPIGGVLACDNAVVPYGEGSL